MTSRASRRQFLKTASALSLAGGAAPFALNLAAINSAAAQTAGDYKATVCLFLFGGNDHTNTIIPYDQPSYDDYNAARTSIAIPRDQLAATSLGPVASQGGRDFAFHPSMTAFKRFWDAGQLAVVANVGTLMQPTTKAQYQARSVRIPPNLFSHNDQATMWQASQPVGEGARYGWGGTMGDLLVGSNTNGLFTCISASGNAVWLSGTSVLQYQVSSNGGLTMNGITGSLYGSAAGTTAYRRLVTKTSTNLFENELGTITSRSIAANELLRASLPPTTTFTTPIPAGNGLASQLSIVARMMYARSTLGTGRQMFFVSMGGFDNHDFLLDQHNQRWTAVNAAVDAFWSWVTQMGLQSQVTLFTASDFGRTLTSNGDGSDHGWGAHHFVLSGAAQKDIHGTFPLTRYGTSDDIGQGNLLPTTSVDQYAATIARWMGVSDTNVPVMLPNVVNFGSSRYLGFLP